jgi:transcriptional regulator GlxA family with amidase domain
MAEIVVNVIDAMPGGAYPSGMQKPQPKRRSAPAPRRIAMLAFPDVQVLDVMGPLEVFSRASRWPRDSGRRADHAYTVEIIGLKRGAFRTSSGLRLHADHAIADVGAGSTRCSWPGAWAWPPIGTMPPSCAGCAARRATCGGSVRSAPARSCWRRPGS